MDVEPLLPISPKSQSWKQIWEQIWKRTKALTVVVLVSVFLFLPSRGVTSPRDVPTPVVVTRHHVWTTLLPTITPTVTPSPTATPTLTPAPLPTSTPSPYGDANGNPAPAPELYWWADWEWRDFASHIVAGEAPSHGGAKRVVACTLIRDVLDGWQPYELRKRWYGWREPAWDDRMAVWNALQLGGCEGLPWYRFVGSGSDLSLWQRRGIVSYDANVDWYGNTVGVR